MGQSDRLDDLNRGNPSKFPTPANQHLHRLQASRTRLPAVPAARFRADMLLLYLHHRRHLLRLVLFLISLLHHHLTITITTAVTSCGALNHLCKYCFCLPLSWRCISWGSLDVPVRLNPWVIMLVDRMVWMYGSCSLSPLYSETHVDVAVPEYQCTVMYSSLIAVTFPF